MNLKEIKELIEFVVKQDLSEIEFEQSGFRIRITKGAPMAAPQVAAVPPPGSPKVTLAGGGEEAAPRGAPADTAVPPDLHVIKSPIVGTFYRSPGPDAEPFVKIGDLIEKGSVVCIIEAMKLMNEIESEVAGETVAIYVENGSPVEYGEPLFAIRVRS